MRSPLLAPNVEVLERRFWSKVKRAEPDACWLWTAYCGPNDYGRFDHRRRPLIASRVAWEFANKRTVPSGLYVLHSCDNPPCCNPAHLRLGTIADNSADMVARGRRFDPYAARTECPRGHALPQSGRCRQCTNERQRQKRALARLTAEPKPPQALCKRGHPLSGDNVYAHNGTRHCKTCKIDRQRAARGNKPRRHLHLVQPQAERATA